MRIDELKELSKVFIMKIDEVIGSLEEKVEENKKNTFSNTKRIEYIERAISKNTEV